MEQTEQPLPLEARVQALEVMFRNLMLALGPMEGALGLDLIEAVAVTGPALALEHAGDDPKQLNLARALVALGDGCMIE